MAPRSRVKELEAELAQLRDENTILKDENTALKDDITTLKDENTAQKDEITALRRCGEKHVGVLWFMQMDDFSSRETGHGHFHNFARLKYSFLCVSCASFH